MGICGIYVRTSVETDGTSIEQQRELGIKFCDAQGFQYQVYEDIGKSGYKVDDDSDPFKNRPGIAKLIDDIEKSVIDKVWVWEYSRLSRNELASYVLRKIFVKNKTVIYENGKQFNMDDPLSIMIDGILTHVSRYERNKITGRTTRGIHDRINTGRRSYVKVYGYRQVGKVDKFITWEPVQSEIENIKYAFQEFLNGKSINSIVKDLHDEMPEVRLKHLHKNYRNILFRFDYTGFSLTTEGSELYQKYKNSEIENLDFFKERKNGKPIYYLKSINYHVQIVSIDDWIIAVKKLRENKEIYKTKKRYASSDTFSGIIKCPYCGLHYYTFNKDSYQYYTHIPSKKCLQRPKSARREKVNSLIEVFYFYYYMVYEDTNEFLKDSRALANLNLSKIKDKIAGAQSENRKIEKQINNFQSLYEESTDKEFVKLTLKKESELNLKLENNNAAIVKLESELSQLDAEFKSNLKLLTYEKVKELIIRFFEELSVEDRRAALIKIIKKCALYKNYLLIQAEKILFIFNVKEDYEISQELYKQFKTADYFKIPFLGRDNSEKKIETYGLNIKIKRVSNFLVRDTGEVVYKYIMNNHDDYKEIKEKLLNQVIDYKLDGLESVICFTEL